MRNLKKMIAWAFILLFALAVVSPAFADDGSPPAPDNFLSLEYLGTIGGATAAVLLIVQFLKAPLDRLWKIPTRFVAYIFAIIILAAATLILKGFAPGDVLLIPLNAIIVTVAAMGTYEATFNRYSSPPG